MKYGILFIFTLFYEYSTLEYVHIHVIFIYRVHQAEYGIRILVAASQEYVNTYSTCKPQKLHTQLREGHPSIATRAANPATWPLHDIAMTNIVWSMACKTKRGSGGGRILRNSRATVTVLQQGRLCR